jgi:hypothetical protein
MKKRNDVIIYNIYSLVRVLIKKDLLYFGQLDYEFAFLL